MIKIGNDWDSILASEFKKEYSEDKLHIENIHHDFF